MHDHWLIALSLAISAFGTIGMMAALLTIEPQSDSISAIGIAPDGAFVHIQGTLIEDAQRGSIQVLTIEQPARIDAVLFDNRSLDLHEGQCIDVIGKRSSYQGEAQIGITKIKTC